MYSITTYGNGEILKGIFDAIAICLNAQSGTLYIPLIRISMIVGGLWAALYAIYGDYMRAINGWLVPMTVIIQLLFVPEVSVWIIDPVSRYHTKVDHVPYGLAMVASRISTIGHEITKQVEKVFVLPDDLKYQKTGTVFASNLLQQAKTFRITNEDLAENMRQFVGQCVAYDALLGRKYTIEDLRHSDDIWKLASIHASPIRSFVWKDLKKVNQPPAKPSIITCKEGVAKFNAEWPRELNKSATIFGKKIFGKNSYINPRAELLQHLPLAYEALANMSKSAQDILKQNMMIYAVVDGLEHKSTSLGNAPNFAVRRAYLQQRSNYETLGAMAAETLPTMKAVLEAIAYGAFLFIVPLAVLPFGWTFLKNWVQILFWLQTWAPLYAILNYIMTMAARSKSISALSVSNELGVTIASSVGLSNVNADIAAMTGYLAMSIPFLCVAIIKGVSSFVSVPGILSGVTQSVAASASSEAATGNYSFGNISDGNIQSSNTNMLNHSRAASYRSGSFQQADGRVDVTTTASGQQILNVAGSNVPVSVNLAETQSTQLSKQASNSYQKGISQSESSAISMADSLNKSVELSNHLASNKQLHSQFGDNKTIEQTNALNKSAQIVKDFAVDNNLTNIQAAQMLAGVSSNVGLTKAFSMLTSVTAGGKLDATISGSADMQKIYRKAEKVIQSEDFQTSLREASQLSHNQSFAINNDEGKRLADNLSKSWNEANNFRQEASKSFSQSEAYQSQASAIKNSSSSVNANYNQQFIEWVAAQPADNAGGGRIGIRGAAYIMAHNPDLATKHAERFISQNSLLPSTPTLMQQNSPNNLKTSYDYDSSHIIADVNKDTAQISMNEIKATAQEQGLFSANNNLAENFTNKEQSAQQELNNSQQNINTEYSNRGANHHVQSKKNLTWGATKKLFRHEDSVAPNELEKVLNGGKQTQ